MHLVLLAEASMFSDPIVLLVAAVGAEASVIVFLIAWIRNLYEQRRIDQEKELQYRDEMLERVLGACGKLADAVAVVTSRRA
jgi:hypothetical protein